MTTYTVLTTQKDWRIYANDRLFQWGENFDNLYELCGVLNRRGQLIWGNNS